MRIENTYMSIVDDIKAELDKASDYSKRAVLQGYFKTGKGEYGEGDLFLGVSVPDQRRIAKKRYIQISLEEISQLLQSKYHEHRLTALLMLVEKYTHTDEEIDQRNIYNFYLEHIQYINNWDLVDLSAPKIIGNFLLTREDERNTIYQLAMSKNMWERRIAMLSTQTFIKHKLYKEALRVAEILIHDSNDIIHKAAGWMIREVGKMNKKVAESFLNKHYQKMPRTMLRYAIEKFDDQKRKYYLRKEKKADEGKEWD